MKIQAQRERAKAITVKMEQRAAMMDMTIEEYMIHLDAKAQEARERGEIVLLSPVFFFI